VEQGICCVEKNGAVWNIELTPVPAGEKFCLTISKETNGEWKAQTS